MPKKKPSMQKNNILFFFLGISFLGIFLLIFIVQTRQVLFGHASGIGNVYYVSKSGSNADGKSWSTAWNELNQINWTTIQPGDTILIDGGTSGMIYTTTLNIGKSGISGAPITIARAQDTGHNAIVTFFGGSTVALPTCNQASWTPPTGTVADAINMNGNSYVTIDGGKWDGIKIHGYTYRATFFAGGESNDTMRNLEIYDNGSASLSNGHWYGQFAGVNMLGTVSNLTFQYMDMHDNGEDNFQSGGSVNTMLVENSWLHETRTETGIPSESFNLCTHNDGFQIYGSNAGANITFQHTILGPGLTNGVIFAPEQDNFVLKDSLILDPGSNATIENNGAAKNWVIDHVTTIGQSDNLTFAGSGNSVTNSIIYDGYLLLNNSVAYSANNCLWGVTQSQGTIQGTTIDPQFVTSLAAYPSHTTDITQYPPLSLLQSGDFTPQAPTCQGIGSSITSSSQFLQMVANEPTPTPISSGSILTPTNSATPTVTISATNTPSPTAFFTATPTLTPSPILSTGAMILYDNNVSSNFYDYSYAYSQANSCDTSIFVSAPCSYGITFKGYGGFNVNYKAGSFSTAPYTYLTFNLYLNNQQLNTISAFMFTTNGNIQNTIKLSNKYVTGTPGPGWVHISIPVSQLNPSNVAIHGLQIRNNSSTAMSMIHLDDVILSH